MTIGKFWHKKTYLITEIATIQLNWVQIWKLVRTGFLKVAYFLYRYNWHVVFLSMTGSLEKSIIDFKKNKLILIVIYDALIVSTCLWNILYDSN